MSILDRIIGKKPVLDEKETAKKKAKKPMALRDEKSVKKQEAKERREQVASKKIAKKEENLAYRILLQPLVSEKASTLGQFNKYVFKVHSKARKEHVRSAVEDYYGVGVTAVNMVKINPKKRVVGRTIGYKQGFKKAIVTLQSGDSIGMAEGV